MTERPILFSGQMVRAILEGRKRQTRRVVKPQPDYIESSGRWKWPLPARARFKGCCTDVVTASREWWEYAPPEAYPYGVPGDRLWVRETWLVDRYDGSTQYAASHPSPGRMYGQGPRWKPSIHMPRARCRLVLDVMGVEVERLQDITSDDAVDEGIEPSDVGDAREEDAFNVAEFAELWDSINGKRPGCRWDDNPWVWVVVFDRADCSSPQLSYSEDK